MPGIFVKTQQIKKSKLYRKQSNKPSDNRALSISSIHSSSSFSYSHINHLLDLSTDFFRLISQWIQPVWRDIELDDLFTQLIAEIDGICAALLKAHYSDEYTRVARYVLFSTADDLIAASIFGKTHGLDEKRLLKKIYQDEPMQDKFFLILEKALQETNHYMDLLELMYVCLQMGYQGVYRYQAQAKTLNSTIKSVYQCLCSHKGRVSQRLTVGQRQFAFRKTGDVPITKSIYALWTSICLALLLFIGAGFWMDSLKQQSEVLYRSQ